MNDNNNYGTIDAPAMNMAAASTFHTVSTPFVGGRPRAQSAGASAILTMPADAEHMYEQYEEPIEFHYEDGQGQQMWILLAMVFVVIGVMGFFIMNLFADDVATGIEAQAEQVVDTFAGNNDNLTNSAAGAATNRTASNARISPVFTPEVQRWGDKIVRWADAAGVEPNHAAIIMQIESCGDPGAASGAGAQGLFQVMPFHFTSGEVMIDPDTNAYRGMKYFSERMVQTNGDVGLAFAGYNGGHGAAASSYNQWANETQRYFYWATGILQDIEAGMTSSPTVDEWLNAGGRSLCQQAAQRPGVTAQLAN